MKIDTDSYKYQTVVTFFFLEDEIYNRIYEVFEHALELGHKQFVFNFLYLRKINSHILKLVAYISKEMALVEGKCVVIANNPKVIDLLSLTDITEMIVLIDSTEKLEKI